MLRVAPAERVCAVVEMNNPGVWVLGEVRKHVQALGMAVAVEYENRQDPARWEQPSDLIWNYQQFAATRPSDSSSDPPIAVPLVLESKFRGHGAMEAWTINGNSYPDTRIAPLMGLCPEHQNQLRLHSSRERWNRVVCGLWGHRQHCPGAQPAAAGLRGH
jgi:hypothetical protein